jgi:hypothetical protein
MENNMEIQKKKTLKMDITYDPAIPLLVYSSGNEVII